LVAASLVDTHCHLADPGFASEVGEVVVRMRDAGVGHAIVIGETPEAAARARALAEADSALSATAGLHPHQATRWSAELARWLADALTDPLVVAAGEMGLDYHYDHSPRTDQLAALDAQLELATQAGKPVVIHAREADEDMIAILRNHPGVVAVMHSFSSGIGLLRSAVRLGHYISWSGMITFKSWQQDGAVREVPEDRLLVETDAPYLAPVPFRGKRNEPAYVAATARKLAQIVGLSFEEIAVRTSANAAAVFGSRVGPVSNRIA